MVFLTHCVALQGKTQHQVDSMLSVIDTLPLKEKINTYEVIIKYYSRKKPYLGVKYALECLDIVNLSNVDTLTYANILNLVGSSYWYQKDETSALDFFIKSLDLREKINDSAGISKSLNNVGVIYITSKRYEEAIEIYNRSLDIKKQLGDSIGIAAGYINLGKIYNDTDQSEIALDYFSKAVPILESRDDKTQLSSCYNNIGVVYMHNTHFLKAIDYLLKADSIAVNNNNDFGLADIRMNLGRCYENLGDYGKALHYYDDVITLGKKLNNIPRLQSVYSKLANTYEKFGNYAKALQYFKIASKFDDSIQKIKEEERFFELQMKFEQEKYEKEIEVLRQKTDIQQFQIEKSRFRYSILFAIIIIVIFLFYLFYIKYKLKSKHNKELDQKIQERTASLQQEIIERKRIQEKELEAQERFKYILNTLPMGVLHYEKSGVILSVNPEFAIMLDTSVESIRARKIYDIIDDSYLLDRLYGAFNDKATEFEHTITVNGKSLNIFVYINSVYSANGKSLGAFAIFEDITVRKKNEEIIKANEARFKDLADSLPEMVSEIDNQGYIKYANKLFFEKLGYDPEFISRGFHALRLFPKSDRKKISTLFRNFNSLKFREVQEEVTIVTLNNKTFDALIKVNAIIKNDIVTGLRSIIIDISNQKKHETELKNAKEKAEEADRLKSAFLANIRHEIRTPMNGIIGFSELIRDQDLSEAQRKEYLDIIIKSSNQLLQIVDDMVNISIVEAGKIDISNHKVDLEQFFNELFVFSSGHAASLNDKITVVSRYMLPDDAGVVWIDGTKLQQVFNSLINNAIKFTKEGFVEFGCYLSRNNLIKFFVKDTGIGISEENQNIIFDHFRQGDHTTIPEYGGTGLGLTISKAIIELMGGKLWVESEIGKGSTFYFTLPYIQYTEDHELKNNETYTKWNYKTLLLYDSNYKTTREIQNILIPSGIKIINISDSQKLLDTLEQNSSIDVIILESQYSHNSEFSLIKDIRAKNEDVPIVVLLPKASLKEKKQIFADGCNDYFVLPVNKFVLMSKLNSFLDK